MYTIHDLLVRRKSDWESISFDTIRVVDLLIGYDSVLMVLSPGIGNTQRQQYDLKNFNQVFLVDGTVRLVDYLASYGGVMPAAITPIKNINYKKKIAYRSIWEIGLSASRYNLSNTVLVQSLNNSPDIIITSTVAFPMPLASLENNVLFTVNGLIAFESYTPTEIHLPGGATLLDRYDNEHLALLDFSALGGFTKIPITANIVSVIQANDDNAIVEVLLPNTILGKTPLFVLNGILHFPYSKDVWIGANTVRFRIRYTDVIAETLNIPQALVTWITPASIPGTGWVVGSVDVIKYLTQGNSAVIVMDTGELSVHKDYLLPTGFAGKFATPYTDNGIVILEDGTIGDYMYTELAKPGSGLTAGLEPVGNELTVTLPKLIKNIKDTAPFTDTLSANTMSLNFMDDTSNAYMLTLYTL